MTLQIDHASLADLYPDPEDRRAFLRRANEILRQDRCALQDALTKHAYPVAADVSHRIQGTLAFLTGDAEGASALLAPVADAARRHRKESPGRCHPDDAKAPDGVDADADADTDTVRAITSAIGGIVEIEASLAALVHAIGRTG
ncbi:hypothetical protein CAL14_13000 [Bordetella genomosp. 9]|uniref:hypothetical protein n=1 Tax=Bordetella genomosp. 9 TaxID=1416803 RepID=UPI000A28D64A|nr:hypothetical protein [Bordetella genomosp. 9]ARP91093.1 hypothetical protein CAL14_13000 [Bordetella genomosp. 9]